MIIVNEPECEAAGVDPEAVKKMAKLLERAGKMSEALGVTIFGGSGSGSLRSDDLILCRIYSGHWDGGDGAEGLPSPDGLLRGER